MKISICILSLLISSYGFAASVKVSGSKSSRYSKSHQFKAACSLALEGAKNEALKTCSALEGEVIPSSWNISLFPYFKEGECSVEVVGICDAHL